METKQLIIGWLNEKFLENKEELSDYAFELLAKYATSDPEFQEWLEIYKARLAAMSTPEAVKAEALQKKQQITDQIALVENVLKSK